MKIIERAKRFLGLSVGAVENTESSASIGTRALLTDAMPLCPLCEEEMKVHLYQHIASTPLSPQAKERFDLMMRAAQGHKWDELARFQDWEATSPDADVYLLRCPDGRSLLAVIRCPYELGDVYKVIHQEQIEGTELPREGTWLPIKDATRNKE